MYQLNDTIVAVSSPTSSHRSIVRISGDDTVEVLQQLFAPSVPRRSGAIIAGSVAIDRELRVDAKLYLFLAPYSYTGDDTAEIHICANPAVTAALMGNLLGRGLRMAGPGEFTARAYLNGKMDLAAAEAVNEVVVSSNKFQLAASEKLLAGRLAETTAGVRADIMDCLSLIEAGLDFSGEEIEFLTCQEAIERLRQIRDRLERLLSDSISCEEVIDLPGVGIAGAPNSGKSSLLNKLLGRARSIVSEQRKTTRDVLTGLLTLRHCRCVLFDCAGLIESPESTLDELAQQAASEAIRNSSVVVFCVDISKSDYKEDIAIRGLMEPAILIPVATKSDLLEEEELAEHLGELKDLFDADFLATSARTGVSVELLRDAIDNRLVGTMPGSSGSADLLLPAEGQNGVALTARHKQAVVEAIEAVCESMGELKGGNEEVCAMMLRVAYQSLSAVERQHVDEEILERIFQRFCVGK